MKTIKILVAASEEMRAEKVQFQKLISELNSILTTRGIELERIKWDPALSGSINDFRAQINECEICLTLYWNVLVQNSAEEFDAAYQELKNGNNPHHIYIFFKEPTVTLTEALQSFKNSIETKYGHFFCKFENVDTMNLQFILKFLASHKELQNEKNPLVTIGDGKVKIGNNFISLDQVPFAVLNKEYQRMQKELTELNVQITLTAAEGKDTSSLTFKRTKLKDEFEQYQKDLFNMALNFAKMEGECYSERLRHAKEEFEKGNIIVSDEILNMEEMQQEDDYDTNLKEHIRHSRETRIDLYVQKTKSVMLRTDKPLQERFSIACEAYVKALSIAKDINYDETKKADIHFDYADLLQRFNKLNEALIHFNEALIIRQHLADSNPQQYMSDYAEALNAVANMQSILHHKEAECNYKEALRIRRILANDNMDVSNQLDLVGTLNNFANYQCDTGDYKHAEQNYRKALNICRQLENNHPKEYEYLLASTLNNFAAFLYDNKKEDMNSVLEAEDICDEALSIFLRLVQKNPEKYEPDYAMALGLLSVILLSFLRYGEAEDKFRQTLAIYRRIAKDNPDKYEPSIAMTLYNIAGMQWMRETDDDLKNAQMNIAKALEIYQRWAIYYPEVYNVEIAKVLNNLAILQKYMGQYSDAEENYNKAIEIYQHYATTNQGKFEKELAETIRHLSILQFDLERFTEAQKNLMDALKIYEQLEEKNPGFYMEKIEEIKRTFLDINKVL